MSDRTRRILGGAGIGVLVVAAVVGSAFLSFLYGFNCLEGDGGEPYVARDSAQKDVCEASGNGLLLFALMAAAAGAFAYFASRLLARWRARQGSLLPGVAALLGIVVAPLLGFWAANLPSDYCSDEQKAAVNEWERSGSRGEPPYDCDAY
jgi:MFS family permease